MKKNHLVVVSLLLLTFAPMLHAGQTFTYPTENPIFEITYPENWEVEQDAQTISAGPSGGGLSSVLMAITGDDLESAVVGTAQGLDDTFATYEIDEPTEGQINEMPVLIFNGRGKTSEGVALDLSCGIFTPDGETFFMMFIFSGGELGEEEIAEMNNILNSIQAK